MKLFTFIALIILTACNEKKELQKKYDFDSILDSLEKKGIASKTIADSAFLGYKFRMTRDQFINQSESLVKEGVLNKGSDGSFYIEIDSKYSTKYKGYIFSTYLHDSLVTAGMIFKDELNPILVFANLADIYNSKYGEYALINTPSKELSIYEKYWFRNNLKILVRSEINSAFVQYVDLRYEKAKKMTDSLEKAKEENKIKNRL